MPRFEEEEGSGYADGEVFEEMELDFFAERSGNDIVENGNEVCRRAVVSGSVLRCPLASCGIGWCRCRPWDCRHAAARTVGSSCVYARVDDELEAWSLMSVGGDMGGGARSASG